VTAGRGPAPAGVPGRAGVPATRRRLLVAMTVAGEAAREIDGLRRALGGSGLGRIDPHVTLVPPVNVREAELAEVLRLVRGVAAEAPAEVVLGPARTFAPRTPVVYLEVGGDTARIAELRRRLSQPPLVPGVARPGRPFVPHVTIGGRVDRARIAGALTMLDGFKLPVSLATVVLCEQDDAAPRHPWHVIADVALGSGTTVGRGGRELVFVGSTILDPETRAWAQSTPGEEPLGAEKDEAAGERFVFVAYAAGRPVGAVVGLVRGAAVEVRRIRVDAALCGEGIGGQLVAVAERAAAAAGCTRIVFAAADGGPVEGFLAHRGYVREAVVAGGAREPHVTLGRSVR